MSRMYLSARPTNEAAAASPPYCLDAPSHTAQTPRVNAVPQATPGTIGVLRGMRENNDGSRRDARSATLSVIYLSA